MYIACLIVLNSVYYATCLWQDMATVVDEVNDKHLGPWAEACTQSGVENTPLTPYIDKELLYNKHLYLDPSKLESTGFSWQVPHITRDKLQEVSMGG